MYAYSRIEYEMNVLDEMIDSEMHKVKEQVLRKLNSHFVHPSDLIMKFAHTLAFGYWESNEHATILADELGLCKLDFLAIAEDFEGFKEEYLRNYEQAENF